MGAGQRKVDCSLGICLLWIRFAVAAYRNSIFVYPSANGACQSCFLYIYQADAAASPSLKRFRVEVVAGLLFVYSDARFIYFEPMAPGRPRQGNRDMRLAICDGAQPIGI